MIKEITAADYAAIDKAGAYLLEFYSKTCGPCKMLSFVLRDVDREEPDFPIYTIDFNENKELKETLGVNGFPCMLFMRDGHEVNRIEGLKQKPVIVAAIAALREQAG